MADLMTTAEVAELCRTTPATVRHWRFVREGPPGARIGTRVLYRRSDVLTWLDAKWQADRERLADAR